MKKCLLLPTIIYLVTTYDAASQSSGKAKRALRMSPIAKQHLSDERNPNNFPRLLGVPFEGCDIHPLMEQSSDLVKLVGTYGSEADATTLQELAQGFDALQSCSPEESFEIFDAIIQHFPESIFSYIGRGISLGRLANKIKASSESAVNDFEYAINLKPNFYLPYRCRAEVHYLTGKYEDALKDAEKDVNLKRDGSSYLFAGIVSYKLEKDFDTMQYIQMAHQFATGHNALAYEFLGFAYFNMGMLRKSVEAFKTSLEYEGENLNALQTLGTLYSELGDADCAILYLNKALEMKADDVKSLETKGHVYYSSGNPREALKWYQACSRNDPTAASCSFMRAVSYATVGQFYNAVKTMTKVMLSSSCNQEYREPLYLRDFFRYLNRRLDKPLREYRLDEDLPENYRFVWAKKLLPNHFNYTEQPGIEPHNKDADELLQFKDLNNNSKILLCKARQFAPLFQYRSDGFMPNVRANKAMAFAAMDVAQTIRKFWDGPKKMKGWKGRHFSWRDLFEVALKWRILVSMDQPVIWLDQLPKQIVDAGFITHMIMKKGYIDMPRYSTYITEALQLAKYMIRSLLGQKLPSKAQEQVMDAITPADILSVLKKYDSTNPSGGFTVGMQVPSSRPKSALLHGVMLSIVGKSMEDITLSIQSARTSAQINQYHAELTYVFNELKEEMVKRKVKENDKVKEKDTTGNLILQLVYYFYNLLPLSRGTSAVSYSVAMGLFMARNKEFAANIPKDKQPDIEAYFAGSSDAFIKKVRSWLTFKSLNPPMENYPSVTETFPSARSIIDVLNVNANDQLCSPYQVT